TDIPATDLRSLIERTYSPAAFDPAPADLVKAGDLWVLELWHGPTLSFKDVALQLLGNLFEYILARQGGRLNILAATSGDTGSAAIYGVRGRKGIDIFMMHPHGRVSPLQERQMTAVTDANVHNIALQGSFDDCQRIMKTLAGDREFKRTWSIGAVNSVNWARVLAQIVYYFHSAFAVQRATGRRGVRFAVPTGNFGDVLAGWYALQMGLPIRRLVLATNENDILSRFFNTGLYTCGPVAATLSPAMDIQVASNFERYLYYRCGSDPARLRGLMDAFAATGMLAVEPGDDGQVDGAFFAGVGDTAGSLAAIRKYHERYGYVLDPHTAVGVCVAESAGLAGDPMICLSTAHPAKFPDAIEQATGRPGLARHPSLDALRGLPTRCQALPNDPDAVRAFIVQHAGR
ncbi:MAG: threonine synthase, partial [Planctomycetota bacterium]|nr:threonine synthase [Planctomycetota bacterium]